MRRYRVLILVAALALFPAGCASTQTKPPPTGSATGRAEGPAMAARVTAREGKTPAPVSEEGEHRHKSTHDFEDDAVSGDLSKPEGGYAEPPPAEKTVSPAGRASRKRGHRRPRSAGVKAGSADDNLQFGAFLQFLAENARRGLPCDVSERIIVKVLDKNGRPLPDADIAVRDGDQVLLRRRSYADGRALVFPSESPALRSQSARLVVEVGQARRSLPLSGERHRLEVKFDFARPREEPVPLDVAFVLDTTGSMGDELARLKQTIEYIHFQITHFEPRPDVRFGMVLYRDRGDEYRTRVVPFTADMKEFVRRLATVRAGGGGDTPEDVQEALRQAMWKLDWRPRGVKIAFLVGDAPPHLDYGQEVTYVDAMHRAAELGIKIATIGASGLDRQGELVWRQLAQYTMAPFVFLTYGESGDSEGSPSTVSHHVGSNWVAENLDAIVVRLIKLELGYYGSKVSPGVEDYFLAEASSSRPAGEVLEDLFSQSVRQLVDYCVQRIEPATPTVVLPLQVDRKVPRLVRQAVQQLQNRLALGLAHNGRFQLVERQDLPKLLATISEQFSSKYDEGKVAELGKLVPAKLAVFSRLGSGAAGRLEMLVKLVRLQTGEILSLSLLKIDPKLLSAAP